MNKQQQLNQLTRQIAHCQKCSLYKRATKAVPGEGNPETEIFFIGEGPGFHEDREGRPFVGAAGHLLEEMLAKIGLKREEVFIGNMVKHRPPDNRDPLPEEIVACQEWLDKQLMIISPKLVVTLGRFSMTKFIPDGKISRIHGQARLVNFKALRLLVVPLFHPAAALRTSHVMQQFREDFLRLPEFLERLKHLEEELPKAEETVTTEVEANKQMSWL